MTINSSSNTQRVPVGMMGIAALLLGMGLLVGCETTDQVMNANMPTKNELIAEMVLDEELSPEMKAILRNR